MKDDLEVESYRIRTCHVYSMRFKTTGWALVYIDNAAGNVAISSDWGDWGYRWNTNAIKPHKTLESFFLSAENDYLANKLRGSIGQREWDVEATQETLKRLLKDHAVDIGETQDWIDGMIEEMFWLEWDSGVDVFLYSASGTDIAEVINPFYEVIEYEPDTDTMFLKYHFLPAFKKMLRGITGKEVTPTIQGDDAESSFVF